MSITPYKFLDRVTEDFNKKDEHYLLFSNNHFEGLMLNRPYGVPSIQFKLVFYFFYFNSDLKCATLQNIKDWSYDNKDLLDDLFLKVIKHKYNSINDTKNMYCYAKAKKRLETAHINNGANSRTLSQIVHLLKYTGYLKVVIKSRDVGGFYYMIFPTNKMKESLKYMELGYIL